MPKIIVLPHQERCPEGMVFDAESGTVLIDEALAHGVKMSMLVKRLAPAPLVTSLYEKASTR